MATLVDVGKAGSQASMLIPAREETAQTKPPPPQTQFIISLTVGVLQVPKVVAHASH